MRDWGKEMLARFQSAAGIDVDGFLRILEFYLRTTGIGYERVQFIQEGVCVGS